jgi:putative ABC transport system permease protein
MAPLSAWTFYRRHKRRTALLSALVLLVTAGLYLMGALVWGVYVEPGRLAHMVLSEFSIVTLHSGTNGPQPTIRDRLRTHPDVARVIPARTVQIQLPGIMPGERFQFDLLALEEADARYVLERFGAAIKDGSLPEVGTNGLLLSEDVATMLGVQVGDRYDAVSSEVYANLDMPLEPLSLHVVGIVESDVELGLVSLAYLNDHEGYRNFPARLLVAAQQGRQAAVEVHLRNEIQSEQASVMTLDILNARIVNEALPGLVMLLPVVLMVTMAFSLLVVVINRIANARRLPEFGILHAVGHSKTWLIRHLTTEATVPTLVGWVMGIGMSWLALYLFKVVLLAPRGHDLDFVGWVPLAFALPIPATVAGFTFVHVKQTLSRLDPVAVVERGELGQERNRQRGMTPSRSSPRPLAAATFYRRHKRRAVLLVSGMGLTIVAVVLIVFVLAVSADAQEPLLGYLSRCSFVRSPGIGQSLDPGVVAQIVAHPALERALPVAPRYSMLSVYIPPFVSAEASPFGVYAEDMAYLVELYGLELQEGHLPRPGSNEMAISGILAQNRGLEVGDVIGDPERPVYPGASSLPTEFVISGILQSSAPEDGSGLGFISLEYLEQHEAYDVPDVPPLIVVPKVGQKDLLDDWLENELSGVDASVLTHRQQVSRIRRKARQDMLSMALLEGVVAVVAAVGLSVLTYILISQRQAEFGVLYAVGYSRRQLVGRVFWETGLTMAAAWGLGAMVVLAGMSLLRLVVFERRGLAFSLLNLAPWLYTLPMPAVVLAVTTGKTARTLSTLDPVSIIERR